MMRGGLIDDECLGTKSGKDRHRQGFTTNTFIPKQKAHGYEVLVFYVIDNVIQ